jgi:hypothetical protein
MGDKSRSRLSEDNMKCLPRLTFGILGSVMMIASSVWAEVPVIGKDSEWNPSMETIREIQRDCTDKQAHDFGKCFVDLVRKSGASAQAVAFARATGDTGYLMQFFKKGRVDLAYVSYPFRANENEGWLLVRRSSSSSGIRTCIIPVYDRPNLLSIATLI